MANPFWADGFWADGFWADGFWVGDATSTTVSEALAREIGDTNKTTIVDVAYVHEVVMVKMEFDTPVYAHSGFGTITYDGNDYLGVGDLGSVSEARESEVLGPTPMQLQLSGVDATLISEALTSGRYGDVITVYIGYRQDDGTLVEAPWVAWKGTFEYATLNVGDDNSINITCQHDLSILEESDGSRYTDEDQQRRFTGDTGFEYVARIATQKLVWGGGPVVTGSGGSGGGTNRPPVNRF